MGLSGSMLTSTGSTSALKQVLTVVNAEQILYGFLTQVQVNLLLVEQVRCMIIHLCHMHLGITIAQP